MLREPLALGLLGVFGIASAALAQTPPPQEPAKTFRVDVRMVEIPLTVLDSSGGVVVDLRRDDFLLSEGGKRQEIRSLSRDLKPAHVVLLLDLSRSVRSQLKNIKSAAHKFIDALGSEDRVAILSFAQQVKLVQGWTANRRVLHEAVGKLQSGTVTQLYDAVRLAVEKQLSGVLGRKAIILITDGVDVASNTSYLKLREVILRQESSIYIISLLGSVKGDMARYRRVAYIARTMEKLGEPNYLENFFHGKEEEMSQLSRYTGGRYFAPTDIKIVDRACTQVALEIKSQFLLTYLPVEPGAPASYQELALTHRIADYQLLYRRGYYNKP